MDEQAKSTLRNKTGKLVGFCFLSHPVRLGWSLNIVFYQTDTQWIMCLSESEARGDPGALRCNLGKEVPGEMFARFAARGVDIKMPYSQFRDVMLTSLAEQNPDLRIEWMPE